MTIGHKIKKIRELKNFTQEHLADKLGMSVAGYGKIERDEVDVPFSRLEQISHVLGMKPEDLISFDEKNVFNIMNNKINNQHFNLEGAVDRKQIEIYEKTIALLEEKIKWLNDNK